MDGSGFLRDSVGSAAVDVTSYAGERLGDFFYTGKILVVSETHSDDVLGV